MSSTGYNYVDMMLSIFFSHLEKAHHLLSAFAICWHISNTLSALTCPATAVSAASCTVARGLLLPICGLMLLTIYTIYTICVGDYTVHEATLVGYIHYTYMWPHI